MPELRTCHIFIIDHPAKFFDVPGRALVVIFKDHVKEIRSTKIFEAVE